MTAVAGSPRGKDAQAQLRTVKARFATAQAAVVSSRTELHGTVLGTATSEKQTALARLWKRAASSVPLALRTINCSDDEWRAIEFAHRAEQNAIREQAAAPSDVYVRLTNARTDAGACAAEARLASTLATAVEAVAGL